MHRASSRGVPAILFVESYLLFTCLTCLQVGTSQTDGQYWQITHSLTGDVNL